VRGLATQPLLKVPAQRPSAALEAGWGSSQEFRWRDSRHALGHLLRLSGSG